MSLRLKWSISEVLFHIVIPRGNGKIKHFLYPTFLSAYFEHARNLFMKPGWMDHNDGYMTSHFRKSSLIYHGISEVAINFMKPPR